MGTALPLPQALPAPLREAPPSRLQKGTVSVVWAASAGSPGDTEGIVPLGGEGSTCACVSVCMNVCACTQHIHSQHIMGKLDSRSSGRCAHVALPQDSRVEVVGSLQEPRRSSTTPPGAASGRGEARVDAQETPVLGNDLPPEVCLSVARPGAQTGLQALQGRVTRVDDRPPLTSPQSRTEQRSGGWPVGRLLVKHGRSFQVLLSSLRWAPSGVPVMEFSLLPPPPHANLGGNHRIFVVRTRTRTSNPVGTAPVSAVPGRHQHPVPGGRFAGTAWSPLREATLYSANALVKRPPHCVIGV